MKTNTLYFKAIFNSLIFLCIFYLIPPNVCCQTNISEAISQSNKIDPKSIFKTIIPNNKSFFYTKEEAKRDFIKCNDFPFNNIYRDTNIINYTLSNIFQESDTILIDSFFIHNLIKRFVDFEIASARFGDPLFFRPDFSILDMRNTLMRKSILVGRLEGLINLIITKFDKAAHSLEENNDLTEDIPIEYLITKVNRIVANIRKDEEVSQVHIIINNLQGTETLVKHLQNFKKLIEIDNNSKITSEILNKVYQLLECASININYIYDLKDLLDDHISILKNNTTNLNDNKYSLLLLLSVDQNINYDTFFINDRYKALNIWLSEMNIDSLLKFQNIQLNYFGKFKINFSTNQTLDTTNKILLFQNFLSNFTSDLPISFLDLQNEFTSKLLFVTSSLFHVPLKQIEIEIIESYLETQLIHYENNEIKSTFLIQCPSCYPSRNIIIHKDELLFNTVSIKYFFVNKSPTIENTIYDALVLYFKTKEFQKDSWKRVKVENGEVIVWLNNVRRLILENENYWENVNYHFKIKQENTNLVISLIIYGEFGTGIVLGPLGKPPSYSAYKPMEPKFTKPLQIYCSDVLYKIKDALIH